ncbi:hypothetical protein I3271_01515 [Photobacterium leiognathi]|uniref:hypothetical protein n=1 Tax=Photobacterium leiognathi TaxID=553611 RepID=UPI001EDF49C7|nr:hypothetical protein [Photobacterium leiognathi]MCG3883357.1 hypothetical protein [Photobacterium leiognathi]
MNDTECLPRKVEFVDGLLINKEVYELQKAIPAPAMTKTKRVPAMRPRQPKAELVEPKTISLGGAKPVAESGGGKKVSTRGYL